MEYLWKKLRAVVERLKWGFRREREERGRDFEGEEISWFLIEMTCFKSFSLETAVSR